MSSPGHGVAVPATQSTSRRETARRLERKQQNSHSLQTTYCTEAYRLHRKYRVSDCRADAGHRINRRALRKQTQLATEIQKQLPCAKQRPNSRTVREGTARDPEGCSCKIQHPVPRCTRKSRSRAMTKHTPEAKLLMLKDTSLQPKTARCKKRWPGIDHTLIKHQVLETFRGKKAPETETHRMRVPSHQPGYHPRTTVPETGELRKLAFYKTCRFPEHHTQPQPTLRRHACAR